ncbi:molybdopterin molybdotransferase [Panacagrimonas perspica]|uniref:Molybdopterin molybdenumtransferase n=1 Tax=Panacagrimonas perspica TaxID=381431 RepID=A0A4R7PBM9_9GAMM|nr:gephyrin-like molybdotransferase Glp [Panacagrimonas perspica]TDU31388.1 molybdopterin molybdotransferase [Panacagrimonas perspica]
MSHLSVEAAFAKLDEAIAALPVMQLPLGQALNRVTAAPLAAYCDLPPFDQSAMDGYALRVADATPSPVSLPLSTTVAAGPHDTLPVLPAGHACRIYTGGLIPQGADAVVRQEWTARDGETVIIQRPTPLGQDIRRQGEELRRGTELIEAGRRLNAGHIAMLSMAGVADAAVRRAPRIRVLVSGDEVVDAGRALRPGEVYNANGPLIQAWLAQAGYADVSVAAVGDTEQAVREALQQAFAQSDLVLTTGGVSVGDKDLIAPEAEKLGARRVLWKVAQKPGKPLYVARHGAALLIGLPGNPASVLVNLATFVRRALDRLEDVKTVAPHLQAGVLASPIKADSERESWVRVRIEVDAQGLTRVLPQTHQASHMLSNLSAADALAWVPVSDAPIPAGHTVRWLSLGL